MAESGVYRKQVVISPFMNINADALSDYLDRVERQVLIEGLTEIMAGNKIKYFVVERPHTEIVHTDDMLYNHYAIISTRITASEQYIPIYKFFIDYSEMRFLPLMALTAREELGSRISKIVSRCKNALRSV